MPFLKTNLIVSTSDGRNVVLQEELTYVTEAGETIVVPVGATADGCSTPKEVWILIPPFGQYWLAAVLHDYLYRKTKKTREECDKLFLEAMESLGVDLILRTTIYNGVRLGGSWAFDDDRKQTLRHLTAPASVAPVGSADVIENKPAR
jgi:hypothetical protein